MIKTDTTVAGLVKRHGLIKHPEGGWYREFYRSECILSHKSLPAVFDSPRNISTAIYFLLANGEFSAFHRIKSDEMWHYYEGTSCLHIHILYPDGSYELKKLGKNAGKKEAYVQIVPAGSWFASEVHGKSGYVLSGCTVAPGFDFSDFEMGKYNVLSEKYPENIGLIRRLTIF